MSNRYPVQCGISVMLPYNLFRLPNGLLMIRNRATGETGTYTSTGVYQSGSLRLAAWIIRPLLASTKCAA
jgi:hypothetical protein